MSEQKIMRCPFRKDENGDFALCYGDECMAHYEYDAPAIPVANQTSIIPPPVKMRGCFLVAPVYRSSYGCV